VRPLTSFTQFVQTPRTSVSSYFGGVIASLPTCSSARPTRFWSKEGLILRRAAQLTASCAAFKRTVRPWPYEATGIWHAMAERKPISNLFEVNLDDADVVALYLLPGRRSALPRTGRLVSSSASRPRHSSGHHPSSLDSVRRSS
jgi:hypothetical protein